MRFGLIVRAEFCAAVALVAVGAGEGAFARRLVCLGGEGGEFGQHVRLRGREVLRFAGIGG
jgi:hypothetical protein